MTIERASLLTGLFALSAVTVLGVASCGRPELPIAVQRARVGLHSDIQPGERITFRRVGNREYAGGKPGFYAFRSKYDFEVFRADLPRSRALPPKDVAFGDEMILAGYSSGNEIDKLEIQNIVDTGSTLHVYATQYTTGEGCPPAPSGNAFDWVALPKMERPITVHLDTDSGPACAPTAPKVKVACRLAQTATWLTELSVPWQSQVECEMQTEPGARAIVDRNWFVGELAKGSAAKLTRDRAGARVTFPADVLGRFSIKLEAVDDEGRRGETTAVINSVPANDDTYVQFGWSAFSSTDEIETFPRLDLKVADVGAKGNVPRVPCTVQGQKPSWCEITTSPVVTLYKVQDAPGRYGVTVRYLDDRYKGMPIACVRVFKKRAVVNEVCDDNPRKAGEVWDAGVVFAPAGMFEHLMPVPDAGAEAGTSDAGPVRDSGVADATLGASAGDAAPPKKAAPAAATKPKAAADGGR